MDKDRGQKSEVMGIIRLPLSGLDLEFSKGHKEKFLSVEFTRLVRFFKNVLDEPAKFYKACTNLSSTEEYVLAFLPHPSWPRSAETAVRLCYCGSSWCCQAQSEDFIPVWGDWGPQMLSKERGRKVPEDLYKVRKTEKAGQESIILKHFKPILNPWHENIWCNRLFFFKYVMLCGTYRIKQYFQNVALRPKFAFTFLRKMLFDLSPDPT